MEQSIQGGEENGEERRGKGILGTEMLRPEASVELGPVRVQGGVGVIALLWVQGSRNTGVWLH